MGNLPEKVVDAAISQIGSPYVFGAWGEFCTPSNRKRRIRSDHPTIKSKCQVLRTADPKPNCDGCSWQGDRMFDCRGLTDWCLKQVGINLDGEGATSQYNTSSNWIEKGDIKNMPECVCCVFVANGNKKSHTGLYDGNGETIECSAGVQRKSLAKKWTHYAIPAGLYTAEEIAEIRGKTPEYTRTVRKGDKGDLVRELQERLNSFGYNCGTVDGIFGSKTLAAVKAFQQDNGLVPDGVVGMETWTAIGAYEVVLYAVTVPDLTKSEADALTAKYPDAIVAAVKG